MQLSCFQCGLAQSLTWRLFVERGMKCSTYKFVEHFRGEVMDVVGQDDCAVKQVSKGHLAVDSPAGTDGKGGHTLAQEQIWHQQQQEQEWPCLNKKNEPLWDDLFNWGYQKPSCQGKPYLSPLPSAWFGTEIAGVGKNQHLLLCKFRCIIIFAQIGSLRSRLLPAFLYCSQKCFCALQTFGAEINSEPECLGHSLKIVWCLGTFCRFSAARLSRSL